MSPRTGRPKVDNPKNHDIKVRLSDADYDELINYCEDKKITKAKAIRNGIRLLLEKDK